MQDHQAINDANGYDDLSAWTDFEPGISAYVGDPYKPPRVPLRLPHVVRFATESGPLLPWEVRSLVILVSRYGNNDGEASVAVSTLCEITNTGSKNTIENRLKLACAVGIMRKEPGKGGKDRKSNTYVLLGKERAWEPMPMDRPGTNPIVALAQVRRHNEHLLAKNQDLTVRVAHLEAEVARLTNGGATGHVVVTDGSEFQPSGETIGRGTVTNGPEPQPSGKATRSYEERPDRSPSGNGEPIGHPRVTNGLGGETSAKLSHSYETAVPDSSERSHEAIGHSELTNGSDSPDEAREYLTRRTRVEALVMEHAAYYERSFKGGVLSAITYFSRSAETEQELLYQVDIRRRARDPARETPEVGPSEEQVDQQSGDADTGRREVEYCPDCDSPYTTRSGADYCPDCTDRRRREGGI